MRYLYASIFLFILGYFHLLDPFRSVFHQVLAPLQFGLREVALDIKDTAKLFSNVDKLRQENLALTAENMELRSQIIELKKVSEENEALKTQIKFKESFDKELLMASIMRDPSDLTGTSFILDKGTAHGIKEGSNIVLGNYLIGIVRRVDSHRSYADFISSSNVSIAVSDIDTSNKTEGLAVGQFGSSIKLNRVLPAEELKVGDNVVTSGKDGAFVPGLLVGKITQIEEVPAETLKSAYLQTYVDLGKIQRVFVLTE